MPRIPITRRRPYTPRRGKVAGQTFASERQYRNALAHAHGHASLHAAQRVAKPVQSKADYLRLSHAARDARDRSFDALAMMRRDRRLSLRTAAKRADTTENTMMRYISRQLRRGSRGRWAPTAYDRQYRAMWMYTERGKAPVDVYDSRSAQRLGEYYRDVERALLFNSNAPLRKYRGESITLAKVRYPFITDLPTLKRLAQAGELSAEGPYRQA